MTGIPILGQTSPFAASPLTYGANVLIVLLFTTLLVVWELEQKNRPFVIWRIVRTPPFAALVVLQTLIVFGLLLILVQGGRAYLTTYWDAVWVSLGGLALLKSLPAPRTEQAERLWGLADWIFSKFYQALSDRINQDSQRFKSRLLQTYATDPQRFQEAVRSFIQNTEPDNKSPELINDLTENLANKPDDEKVKYLANYIAPRTTETRWRRLTP